MKQLGRHLYWLSRLAFFVRCSYFLMNKSATLTSTLAIRWEWPPWCLNFKSPNIEAGVWAHCSSKGGIAPEIVANTVCCRLVARYVGFVLDKEPI